MIKGIGTDIVDSRRIEKCFKRFGNNFEKRIYSESEIKTAKAIKDKKKRLSYYSKRFAAKEAFAKAMGTGIGRGFNFKDISVENDKKGKPLFRIKGKLKPNIHLSLSDEYPYSQAFVVIGME